MEFFFENIDIYDIDMKIGGVTIDIGVVYSNFVSSPPSTSSLIKSTSYIVDILSILLNFGENHTRYGSTFDDH